MSDPRKVVKFSPARKDDVYLEDWPEVPENQQWKFCWKDCLLFFAIAIGIEIFSMLVAIGLTWIIFRFFA